MRAAWKSIVITAILAALASGAATWASATWVMRERQPPSLHSVVHEKLDLSPEQDRRLDVVEARFAAQRPALEAEVRAANRELAAAIAASDGDTPQVQAAVDHFHAAMGDLQKATITHVFEMRSVLSPAQAEVFDAAVVEALHDDAGYAARVGAEQSIEARAATGDRAAFTALMAATKADLYRFVRRYVGDESEAHDVLQESYASAWLALRRYDPARPFDVWLRSIALNKCRDWGRRRAVRRVVRGVMGLEAPEAAAVGDDAPSPETRLDDQRKAQALQRALRDLPDALKGPLLLATLEGRSHAEIASILGITPKAVETRVARARKTLTAALGQASGGDA